MIETQKGVHRCRFTSCTSRLILTVSSGTEMSIQMYKISGHETFPCRYAWLPKAFLAIESDPKVFADEEKAMVTLGVGKNMVRAIRFWAQAADRGLYICPDSPRLHGHI